MRRQSLVLFLYGFLCIVNDTIAQSINIPPPGGSGQFGKAVTVLANGNYVITDPLYDNGAIADAGAVHLYNGTTHAPISTLTGSTANNQVGSGGITVLTNSNFVVKSPLWDNGAATDAGAVTFYNGTTGLNGVVSSSNSLVGSTASDNIGNGGVFLLTNGNYVVSSYLWDNGAATNAGAATWGNGTTGVSGVVSSSNSLVGNKTNDGVSNFGVTALTNGNYVVKSSSWGNGAATSAGAATFGNGTTGITGIVSSSNSLVGGTTNSQVGLLVLVLPNGNYLVQSSGWDNGAISNVGASTFGNGITGITGVVSSSNSLVGSSANDDVGNTFPMILPNGNYVLFAPEWDNGAAVNAGAVTWCSGTTGRTGVISSSNSLVGGAASCRVGDGVSRILSNGNYVVGSVRWDNVGASDAGAVTWCSGTTGRTGIVSSANSLVGSTTNDLVGGDGHGILVLSNGNYVVQSGRWNNGAIVDAGAVTWGNGTTGVTGVISGSNSLIGSVANDLIGGNGFNGLTALSNGNYVVNAPYWNNGAVVDAGAVIWANGTTGITGIISSANALTGSIASDVVGLGGSTALTNGNYVIKSPAWDNGAIVDAGAVTWANGTTAITGTVSNANSLVGGSTGNSVGSDGVDTLSNGNYVVSSSGWDNGAATDAGAVTWGNGTTGITGVVSSSNSLVGSSTNDRVGNFNLKTLGNGNYVVNSPYWSNGAATQAGAVTWGSGTSGISGVVSSSNSLIGTTTNDFVGYGDIYELSNNNYLVNSYIWNNGAATSAGAITWGSGISGISGVVSSSNSLVGSSANDQLGFNGFISIKLLNNGNYVVRSDNWDNGATANAGAITYGNGTSGVAGTITNCNSVIGNTASGGAAMAYDFNYSSNYLVAGKPSENAALILNPSYMALANSLDVSDVNISGTNTVPLKVNTACRIIASLQPNGAAKADGTVNSKVWIEPSVPSYNSKPFVARHFEIKPVNNTLTATGRITLYVTQQEFDDFNADPASIYDLPASPGDILGKYNLKIGRYTGNSSDGSGLPGTYNGPNQLLNPDDNDIIWNSTFNRWEISFDVTGFGGFIIQSHSYLLPLTLLLFDGHLQNKNGVLNWKTTNELNAASFDIERSIDGNTYQAIGNKPAFNQAGDHQYFYTDSNITALGVPVVYYRLKQKDIAGGYMYSKIVALPVNDKNIFRLYPNPVKDKLHIMLNTGIADKPEIHITDAAGRTIQQFTVSITTVTNTLTFHTGMLPKGVYFLIIRGKSINRSKMFVKQ